SEICLFFFSSRRRHTRFSRDWSSDVCSSDLHLWFSIANTKRGFHRRRRLGVLFRQIQLFQSADFTVSGQVNTRGLDLAQWHALRIGQGEAVVHTVNLQSLDPNLRQ